MPYLVYLLFVGCFASFIILLPAAANVNRSICDFYTLFVPVSVLFIQAFGPLCLRRFKSRSKYNTGWYKMNSRLEAGES